MAERVCFLSRRVFVVSDGRLLPTVTLVDEKDQVVELDYYNIEKLQEFCNSVCQDIKDHQERQAALNAAEARCNNCPKMEDSTDWPHGDGCQGCDNQQLGIEAIERYA